MEIIRDYIYVNYDEEMCRAISSGIEFKEFIQALSLRPQNILVLEGHFIGSHDFTTQCEYCVSNDIEDFLEEDVYNYGNFAWLDFDKVTSLETLEPREVAQLYYLGKKWMPITSTYFHKLNNRFVYTAHDDGWVNYIYYNQLSDFTEVLGNVILSKVKRLYKTLLPKMGGAVLHQLYELTREGIVIDILRAFMDEDGSVAIPIYRLGMCRDMDEVYTLVREKDIMVYYELKYTGVWEVIKL